jgi:hypothetical protein
VKKLLERATDWAARLAGARTAVEELHATDHQLREAHAAAQRGRDRLISAPPPVDEVIGAMVRVVDAHAAGWAREHAVGLIHAFGPGLELERDGTLRERPARMPDWFLLRDLRLKDVVGAFPELVKARLAEIIRGHAYEAGPSQTERARLVAEADARIAELEAQHTELVDAAGALTPPIVLALLPAVQARRDADAARRQREGRAEQDRQAREAAVNRQHDQAQGGTPSPYLAEQARRRVDPA